MSIKVIKRDGRVKSFDNSRIIEALKKAYEDVYKEHDELEHKFSEFDTVCMNIYEEIILTGKNLFTVEDIQDIIVSELNKINPVVAKSYRDYREQRTMLRNSKMELIKEICGLLYDSNVEVITENFNK